LIIEALCASLFRGVAVAALASVFCDFLSIYQEHDPATTPELNAGRIVKLLNERPEQSKSEDACQVLSIMDEDGLILSDGYLEFTMAKALEHEGSFDTSIHIKSEAGRVMVSGNVGRFGRPDNVFGYSVVDCVRLANGILRSLGLPEFTWGNGKASRTVMVGGVATIVSTQSFTVGRRMHVDAIITRIDLTQNYMTGSPSNLAKLIHYMGGLRLRSQSGKSYASGVTWGEGSSYWYAKLYDKLSDLVKGKGKSKRKSSHVPEQLLAWVEAVGLARFEVSLKSRYLDETRMKSVGVWERDGMENVVYGKFTKILTQMSVNVESFDEIPGKLRMAAMAWRNGHDVRDMVSPATFYRYRNQLLTYGIDIAEEVNVSRLPMRVSVIELQAVQAPDWYQLPLVA
jgi:hypothetical protein